MTVDVDRLGSSAAAEFTQRHEEVVAVTESALAERRTITWLTDVVSVTNAPVAEVDAVGCGYGAD